MVASTYREQIRFITVVVMISLIGYYSTLGYQNYAAPTRHAPALASARSHSHPIYSGHNCVGLGTSTTQDATRCRFRNVCLQLNAEVGDTVDTAVRPFYDVKPSSVRLFYYRPPEARKSPLYWFESYDINWSWVRIDHQSRLSPEIEWGSIPDGAVWSPAETTVLSGAFWPENYAHSLGDDFFPVYRLAKAFGLWNRRDLQVIFHPECSTRGGDNVRGCEHHQEMSEMLLDRPLESKKTPLWAGGKPVCFKNLLVGTRQLGMGTPSEGIWPPFVREIKQHFGLALTPKPRKQKISIFRKNGRRTFTNYDALAAHLRRRFGVEVELIDPASFTIKDQIFKLEKTTVIVSPCGGVSFSSMFLPPGASAVFADYWETAYNTTAHMDIHSMTWQSDVTPYYYPLEYSDLTLDRNAVPPQFRDNEQEVMRSWANVTINLPRMDRYVFTALLQAEVAFGFANSFDMVEDRVNLWD